MGLSLWQTLLRPDQEELVNADRTQVAQAANYLQVGEFQLLQLAYREWHGKDLPESMTHELFHAYMLHSEVPHWATHYARQILRLVDVDRINENDPRHHCYDHDYVTEVPDGVKKFSIAVACLVVFFVGAIITADMAVKNPISMFPPHLDSDVATPEEATVDGFGRADSLHPRPGP